MISRQMKEGSSTEKEVESFFHTNGYWVYVLPKKVGGQPFDIIACKKNDTWFVDAKHLEASKASFNFERIEPNQRTSMRYAKKIANITNLGFIIKWDRVENGLYYLPYSTVEELEKEGNKSVRIEELNKIGEILNVHKDMQ